MSGPFVIRAVSRIKPGLAEEYKPNAQEICRLVEEAEPRVLAFNIWVSDKADSEVVLQIHPDPESLENHLALLGDRVRATFEFADFESLEVHGPPSDRLRRMLHAYEDTVAVTYHPIHWGGFTRLQGS